MTDDSMSIADEIESRRNKYDVEFSIHLRSARRGRSSIELARQVASQVIKSIETLDDRIQREYSITSDEAISVCDLLVEASEIMDLVARRLDLDLDAEDGGRSAVTKSEEKSADFALYCDYEDSVQELIERNTTMVRALGLASEGSIPEGPYTGMPVLDV